MTNYISIKFVSKMIDDVEDKFNNLRHRICSDHGLEAVNVFLCDLNDECFTVLNMIGTWIPDAVSMEEINGLLDEEARLMQIMDRISKEQDDLTDHLVLQMVVGY